MPTLVQLWQTTDGKTFPTESAAKDHERIEVIAEVLTNYPANPLGSKTLARDIAAYLLKHFEIVRKPHKPQRSRQGAPGGGGTPPAEEAR